MPFLDRHDHELDGLADEELIAFLVAARGAGRPDRARAALAILVFGHHENLVRRASVKLPTRRDAEDVASDALESALKAAFNGVSVGEFVNWVNRILARRIADFYRRRGPVPAPLTSEHEGDDEYFGPAPEDPEGDPVDVIAVRDAIERVFERLSEPHGEIVDLYVFAGHSAGDAAGCVEGMTEANVHKIASRFRRDVRVELDGNTEVLP